MNPKPFPNPPRLSTILLAGFTSAFCIVGAEAQVVIEGGPGVIQISDRDGRPEPVVPGGVPQGAPVPFETQPPSAVLIESTPPTSVEVQPDPSSPVTVRVPVLPAPKPVPAVEGTAAPAVPPLDVASAKRKAELIRELGIADSGTGAKIAFATEDLYEKDSAQIEPLAKERLELLAEFVRLQPLKKIALTYHFSPTLHNETIAWQRSVILVEWLKLQGKITGAPFTVNEPTVMVEEPRNQVAANTDTIPPFEKVEIVIEYR